MENIHISESTGKRRAFPPAHNMPIDEDGKCMKEEENTGLIQVSIFFMCGVCLCCKVFSRVHPEVCYSSIQVESCHPLQLLFICL